jgi:hypothetical protein
MTDPLLDHSHPMPSPQMNEESTMNESSSKSPTDNTDADAMRRAKVADLQRRRSSVGASTTDPRSESTLAPATATSRGANSRKSVGQASKIAATAMGMTAMLAIVGGMSVAAQRKAAATPTPATAPAQVIVVIHPAGPAGAATPTAVQAPGKAIALSAQPVVRQAAAASAAPVAKTSGSH